MATLLLTVIGRSFLGQSYNSLMFYVSIFIGEVNHISPVLPEHNMHWESPPHMTVEQFHLLLFLILSSWVSIPNLQEVLATDPKPCDANQKYLFVFISAPPPYHPDAS